MPEASKPLEYPSDTSNKKYRPDGKDRTVISMCQEVRDNNTIRLEMARPVQATPAAMSVKSVPSMELHDKIVETAHTRRRWGCHMIHDVLRPKYPGINHKLDLTRFHGQFELRH
jgi:hypothetical protein